MSSSLGVRVLRGTAVVALLLGGGCTLPAARSPDPVVVRTVVPEQRTVTQTSVPPAGSSAATPPATAAAAEGNGQSVPRPGSTPETEASRPTTVGPPRSSVFCGPSVQDVRSKTKAVVDIIERAGLVELRPPCNSRYGRKSTGELVYAGHMTLDAGTVRDNRTMLAFAVANHCRYYVDDVRFIAGDPTLVSAAFDDYHDYLYSGLFGIELPDEPTIATLEQNLTIIRQLGDELAHRNAADGQRVALTDIVRPSVNYVPGSDRVIPALRAALGPHARFSMDAYTTDEKIWRDIMALYGVVDGVAAPGTAYDIQLTVPMSRWVDRASGAARSPDVTSDTMASYIAIAASYRSSGVTGVMLFTGFAAADNIYDDHFEGTLLQSKVLDLVLDALDRYAELMR